MKKGKYGPFLEEWKDIKDYEGRYQVSNYGRVKSLSRWLDAGYGFICKERILVASFVRGYQRVGLLKESKKHSFLVHRLVAAAFIPNPDNLAEVNHLDSIRNNPVLYNLEWTNKRENLTHGFAKYDLARKYPGVYCETRTKIHSYYARIHLNGKTVSLGKFDTAELAHERYLVALKENNIVNKYA